MANLFRFFIFFICGSFLFCQVPGPAFAKYYTANKAPTRITENAPQILAPPELPIPVKSVEKTEKKAAKKDGKFNKKWLWGIAGIAVLAGIIAAVAGGGSGGGGGGGDDDDDTGSITVAW